MTSSLRQTELHDWHASHGGRMVEFGGWSMPVQYTGIVDEHHAVRRAAGLFDISHMGRLKFKGHSASLLLDELVTCAVSSMKVGQIRYGLVCNEAGGILDDVLVYRFEQDWGLVVNASNRRKILDWLQPRIKSHAVEMIDETESSAMIAVQGPRAIEILQPLTALKLAEMKYYSGSEATVAGHAAYISRTGYTGEDGFEISLSRGGVALWNQLLDAGRSSGLTPCGLGARDTLRLEAAMPLYGHELSESIDPISADLSFAVKFEKETFTGRSSLWERQSRHDLPVRVGLQLEGRRIAREHSAVFAGPDQIGEVTSGTFSPTLEKSIAMGYLPISYRNPGTQVEIDIRGKRESATVVSLPFYKRAR